MEGTLNQPSQTAALLYGWNNRNESENCVIAWSCIKCQGSKPENPGCLAARLRCPMLRAGEKECHALWCGRMLFFHGLNLFIIFVVAFNLTSMSFHSNPVSLFTFRALAFAQQTWRHFCQVLFSPRTLEWPQSIRSWTLPNRSSKLELPSNFYLRAKRNPKRVDFREEYIRIPHIYWSQPMTWCLPSPHLQQAWCQAQPTGPQPWGQKQPKQRMECYFYSPWPKKNGGPVNFTYPKDEKWGVGRFKKFQCNLSNLKKLLEKLQLPNLQLSKCQNLVLLSCEGHPLQVAGQGAHAWHWN